MKFVKISLQAQTDNFESIALLGTWFDMFQRTERNGHIFKANYETVHFSVQPKVKTNY